MKSIKLRLLTNYILQFYAYSVLFQRLICVQSVQNVFFHLKRDYEKNRSIIYCK